MGDVNMDPTKKLNQIRDNLANYRDYYGMWHDGNSSEQLAEHVTDLDNWMSNGGLLPQQWQPTQGRPRREQDGKVLEGVQHGKRSSYNKGCRCLECTEANRIAGANQRAAKKGH